MTSEMHFRNLRYAMEGDNGCSLPATAEQIAAGIAAVERMAVAGFKWPATEAEAVADLDNLDGIYWDIAAGEQTERQKTYSKFDGYFELDCTLNNIFDNPRTVVEASCA